MSTHQVTKRKNFLYMKEIQVSREVTELSKDYDTFLFFDRTKKDFHYPLHYHPEFEINFVKNAAGSSRLVGDSIETIDDYELCLIGPNLYHVWENGACDPQTDKREITIQFVSNIFGSELLKKDIFAPIALMLKNSSRGIKFSRQTAIDLEPLLEEIGKKKGFESFTLFLTLLNTLAVSEGQKVLSNASFQPTETSTRDERLERVYTFLQKNYCNRVKLKDIAEVANMSPMSFTRWVKQRTGKSFILLLNEIRLGVATRMMIDSNKNISEICFACGFNNISNFNRFFKKKQGVTPSEFRKSFEGTQTIF